MARRGVVHRAQAVALVCAVACAAAITSCARRPICAPEWVISSTVAAVSCTAASCSSTTGRLLLRRGADLGRGGVEVLGRLAALLRDGA